MLVPVRRALVSVSDKQGLTQLGQFLGAHNTEILSTGGTAAALRAAGVKVSEGPALHVVAAYSNTLAATRDVGPPYLPEWSCQWGHVRVCRNHGKQRLGWVGSL